MSWSAALEPSTVPLRDLVHYGRGVRVYPGARLVRPFKTVHNFHATDASITKCGTSIGVSGNWYVTYSSDKLQWYSNEYKLCGKCYPHRGDYNRR